MIWKLSRRKHRSSTGWRKERGQAVVEFALVMIFFLLLLLAVVDLGRAYFSMVALENAASEGALYGMANPGCIHQGDCGAPEHSVEFRVRNESQNALMDPGQVQFTVEFEDPSLSPGTFIRVTVQYPFHPIIPLVSAFGADTILLRQEAIQLIP